MKLYLFTSKKIYLLISLYFLISSQSILSISNDRIKGKIFSTLKSQGKVSLGAGVETGSSLTYEANLTIENTSKNIKEEVAVYIDKKNFENNRYGFEVLLKDKSAKITSPVFFPLTDGVYFFTLKALTSPVDCLNGGLFSKNGMNFMHSVGGDNITVSFKYPNSWAFGEKNDIDWLCRKISENYNNYTKKESEKKIAVLDAINQADALDIEKSKKITSKTELEKYITSLKAQLETENAKLSKITLDKETVYQKLKEIESSKGPLVMKNRDNDLQIVSKESDINSAEEYIKNYTNKSKDVKEITKDDVQDSYIKVKEALLSMLKFISVDDPMYKKIKDLTENVQLNKDKILDVFK